MKKAVITTGGKQYLVSEGDVLEVEKLTDTKPTFEALMVIGDSDVKVGKPNVDGVKVSAEVVKQELLADKVLAIRYKSKKRVHKVRGHRQRLSQIKITKIS
jgi:large subunit ribosomal protein L21